MNKYFLYVGNAYPHKNLNNLVKAIVKLNQEVDEKIVLRIVSSRNEFTQRLEMEVKKQSADGVVELLGFVADKELKNLYKNSIAFVFPSLSEGFGLPGIEAMENETLVVCSDIEVFQEIYQDNAYYFDPKNINSILESLKEVYTLDLNKRKEKISKAKKFVGKYSWSRMAKETLDVYNQAVK